MRKAKARREAGPTPSGGNTKWAAAYGDHVKEIIQEGNKREARSQQVQLGPSEIGVACDRMVVGKLTRTPKTNTMGDSWASTVGTAIHAKMEEYCEKANARREAEGKPKRYYTELRVFPAEDIPGTTDLYDAEEKLCLDWKNVSTSMLAKYRREGPSLKYEEQAGLYCLGLENAGFEVKRMAICFLPRTESSLEGMYVWEKEWDDEARERARKTLENYARRKNMARLIQNPEAAKQVIGRPLTLLDIPASPDQSECTWCPFYRPYTNGDPEEGTFRGCTGYKGSLKK